MKFVAQGMPWTRWTEDLKGCEMATRKKSTAIHGSRTGRPVMALLDLLGRRWTLRILWELREKPLTFRALQAACGNLSPSVLNDRLRELREAGILELRELEGYRPTALAIELGDILIPLDNWAKRWAKRSGNALVILVMAAIMTLASSTRAQNVSVERMATGLARPVFLTAAPGDLDRAFILEQHLGQIRILDLETKTLHATPFLTISNVSMGEEQGLLGLAFHPDYASNGFFYVSFTDPDTRILRYRVSDMDPNLADPLSATPILDVTQPQANHNGGWLGFGPDGYLYVSLGDGGSRNDTGIGHSANIGNAQDLTNLLGSLLRIDVDADDFPMDPDANYAIPPSNPFAMIAGRDEIWAYGLRNPWRPSFDRVSGDLYIADVGQSACEEINIQLGGGPGGENYGWRPREGVIATPTGGVGGALPAGAIDPFFDYPHPGAATCSDPPAGFAGFSITGGHVYRGPVASLQGRYFFGDFVIGRLWSLVWDGSLPTTHNGTNFTDLTDHALDPDFDPDAGLIGSISSFGEDAAGNLFVVDLGGEVFRVPEPKGRAGEVTALACTLLALIARRRVGRA